MTEIEEELIATLADVRRARNEAADLVVRTARERDAALARAEAAEAERDAANALGAETTVQLKSAQYHLGVMVKAWEAAEARIAAALAIPEPEFSDRPFANENGANDSVRGQRSMRDRFRAALAEPVEPQPYDPATAQKIDVTEAEADAFNEAIGVGEPEPSACATCNGFRFVCDFGGFTDACGDDRCVNDRRPCPSCTPEPSACTTCGGEKWVDDPTWALADELPPYVPCPSCTPPAEEGS